MVKIESNHTGADGLGGPLRYAGSLLTESQGQDEGRDESVSQLIGYLREYFGDDSIDTGNYSRFLNQWFKKNTKS